MHSSASLEGKSFSGSGLQMSTCTDEHIFKVRKSYTITKQRERWTEEEHNKFLEALKMYGRAWRQIEEHVCSKTAVQIRSHAQKFFSKVVRDSTLNSVVGTAIEIPPPRPKRKPAHPYPRKLGNISPKTTSEVPRQERSVSVVSDQDNQSPTSVLSGIGSSFSSFTFGCASPSVAGGEKPNEKESYQSQTPDEDGTRLVLQGPTSMDHDIGDQLIEVEAAPPVLKLFGRDVPVTNSKKPSPLPIGDSNYGKQVPAANAIYQAEEFDHDGEPTDQGEDSSEVSGDGVRNIGSGAVPQMFFYMPLGNNPPAEAPVVPVALWAFFGGVPLPSVQPQNLASTQNAAQSCIEAEDWSRQHKERSWTDSNTSSVSEVGPAHKTSDAFASRSSASSLKLTEKADTNRPCKGFVPYKRV